MMTYIGCGHAAGVFLMCGDSVSAKISCLRESGVELKFRLGRDHDW